MRRALDDAVLGEGGRCADQDEDAALDAADDAGLLEPPAAGSADADATGTGVQSGTMARFAADEDHPVRYRIDDVTTGAMRLLALPTDVAPMDDPGCRAAVAAAVDRAEVQEELGGAGNAVRRSVLWPQALRGGPEDPDPEPDPQSNEQSPAPKPAGGIGRDQAEQLLNSAARDERDVQGKKQRQSRSDVPPGGKDW